VTPGVNAPLQSGSIVHREERIEYRDEHGNILNEDQIKELSGKVSFQTRYETRTRIIDALGNELYEGPAGSVPEHLKQHVVPVPDHPDVEGGNPETKGAPKEGDGSEAPPSVDAERDLELDREWSAKGESGKPKPASEKGKEATKKEL
jgi:dolichyl-phosphate-mannose-protein mannosyltransferase